MLPEIERRTFGKVELRQEPEEDRAAEPDPKKKKPKKPKMEGYAALFGTKSEEMFGFREVIMPGAFDRALRESHDVRALVNHNPDLILGRTTSGTLALSIDQKGLRVEIEPPDTTVGRDAVVSVERGDLSQMSFAFRTLTDDYRLEDGEVIRELMDLELLDVSVVAYPAYLETDVQVSKRALDLAAAAGKPKAEEAPPEPTTEEPPAVEAPPAEPEPAEEPPAAAAPPAGDRGMTVMEARLRLMEP